MSDNQVWYITGDITEHEFIHSLGLYINRAYYPHRKCEIGRVGSLDMDSRTGPLSVKSVLPFFLCCRTTSFIPSKSNSHILDVHRERGNRYNQGVFFFTPHYSFSSAAFEQHNALQSLSRLFSSWYCVPMLYSRKQLRIMQNLRLMNPLQYGDSSIITETGEKRKAVLSEIPLLKNVMLFSPHADIDRDEFPCTYSVTADGAVLYRGNDAVMDAGTGVTFQQFIHDMLRNEASGVSLESYVEQVFDYIPDVFGTSWSSRTLKSVVQQTVDEIVQLNDRAGQSFKHQVEELGMYEKLVLVDKLLSRNFNIIQYLMVFRD